MQLDLKHHHGGISVPDLEASIRWYAEVLDFEVEQRLEIPAIPAKVAMLWRGDLRLELFEVPGAQPLPEERRHPNLDLRTHGNKHLAFAIKDIDSAERCKLSVGFRQTSRFNYRKHCLIVWPSSATFGRPGCNVNDWVQDCLGSSCRAWGGLLPGISTICAAAVTRLPESPRARRRG